MYNAHFSRMVLCAQLCRSVVCILRRYALDGELSMATKKPRNLSLSKIIFTYRLPLPGIISILHRISGVGLFLCLPFLLYLLQNSLGSPDAFEHYRSIVANPLAKLLLIGLIWAYLHHFCAGIRYLFLDVHKGLDLATTRVTSKLVLVVSITLTAVLGAKIW